MASMGARRCVAAGLKAARAVAAAERRVLLQGATTTTATGTAATEGGFLHRPRGQFRSVSSATFEPGFHWRKMVQAHHMSCCANLGNPAPREVIVEYCEESDYTDYFIELADKVENAHPELAVLVSPNNMHARKGSFEITCDGHVLWSKMKKGRLPRFEDVLDGIAELPSKCDIEPAAAKSANA